ncbi:MAG: hypothetical protein Q9179_007795 [Wetmoreana sp. 5 TL-2023]
MTFQTRLEALQLAGDVCDVQKSLELVFKQAGMKVDTASQKAIKAFDKVANYRHLSERLSRLAASSRFRHLFTSLHFRFMDNYAPHLVNGRERFVHAEVQIVTFHRLQKTRPSPRTIGTTKATCYLCNLFISFHPQYITSATHGVIFDAWTIPDLLPYTEEDRRELRAIVRGMREGLQARVRKGNHKFLPFPTQSGIYHVPSLPSLAGTLVDFGPSVETASISTVRTISGTRRAVAMSSAHSVEEAVTIPLLDCNAESPRGATGGEHSKEEEFGPPGEANSFQGSEVIEKAEGKDIVEPDENHKPDTEVKLDAATEDREDSKLEETSSGKRDDSEHVQVTEQTQVQCAPLAYPEMPDLKKGAIRNKAQALPHHDDTADNGCASSAHQDRYRHRPEPCENLSEKLTKKWKSIQESTLAKGAEGGATKSELIKVAESITINRDSNGQPRTRLMKGARGEDRTANVGGVAPKSQEANTAFCKAFGEWFVALRNYFVDEKWKSDSFECELTIPPHIARITA